MCWAVLPWGLDAGSWGHALWQHRESSKGHLPGQQAQGACVLNWCECGAQRLAAREGEVLVSAARTMLTCLDMSLPSGGSQKHLGVTCQGIGAQEACMLGRCNCGAWQSTACCWGLVHLVGSVHAQKRLTEAPGGHLSEMWAQRGLHAEASGLLCL